MDARNHVSAWKWVQTRIDVWIAGWWVHTRIDICIDTRMHTNTQIHTCAYTTYVYKHKHMHTHTNQLKNTLEQARWRLGGAPTTQEYFNCREVVVRLGQVRADACAAWGQFYPYWAPLEPATLANIPSFARRCVTSVSSRHPTLMPRPINEQTTSTCIGVLHPHTIDDHSL